jgi:membrane associated rhomboid family serine protease
MVVMQDTLLLRFARHGMLLLLAGLLTGFGIGIFDSHHFANAAHLTGVIGGFGLLLGLRVNLQNGGAPGSA